MKWSKQLNDKQSRHSLATIFSYSLKEDEPGYLWFSKIKKKKL